MRVYDTALRRIADFQPGHEVRLYICGITPYDAAHLGHVLTFLTYDLLQRRLEDAGHQVKMVRNITDVDEPIYVRAAELKLDYRQLAADETAAFQTIMKQLAMRPPAAEPKASEYIAAMSDAVRQLRHNSYAYQVGADWYFDTGRLPAYGQFSRFDDRLLNELMAMRGGDPERPGKHSPRDFLLWKSVNDPADPAAWASPLGRGRPGWHIECTVMSSQLLGLPFDLHGGGSDLIFPHHESEIAQAEGLGQPLVARHWSHVSPLLLHGEKMSKSLGNLIFAKDLLKDYEPSVVRLALMHYHYRTGGEWRAEFLPQAAELLAALRHKLLHSSAEQAGRLLDDVRARLDDNLDNPEVVCRLRQFVTSQEVPAAASNRDAQKLEALLGLELR